MKKEYYFVSCDIVAHSAEQSLEKQKDRVTGINQVVAAFVSRSKEIIWASGGDGGHVAIPTDYPPSLMIECIVALREWSMNLGVPLRISANLGIVDCIAGADGRKQLVGFGINLAGRLIPFAGPNRVVVSTDLRDRIRESLPNIFKFHDERMIRLKSIEPQNVCLLSHQDKFESAWDEVFLASDRAHLQLALEQQKGLSAIYRARRILEMNPSDSEAVGALRTLTLQRSWIETRNSFIENLFIDEEFGPQIIRSGSLVDRKTGEILCELNEEGETMFWILKGRVGGFLDARRDGLRDRQKPDFEMMAGELAGELAFGLRRRRTATLYCLEDTAVLVFSYAQLIAACPQADLKQQVEQIVDRKITARAMENLWNTAPYFRAMERTGLLAEAKAPWLDLIPYSQRTRLIQAAGTLEADNPVFKPEGLCILIGGTVLPKTGNPAALTGNEHPILAVNFPGEIRRMANDYELLEDVNLLTIKKEGLRKLGPNVHKEIIKRLHVQLSKSSYLSGKASVAELPMRNVEALQSWREKLEYLLQQEAIAADPNQKFALAKYIAEAKQKIEELNG